MKKMVLIVFCLTWVATAAAFQPRTGHWWNPLESGRGFNIDVQDDILVVAMYAYQAGGTGQWYLASGPMTNSGHNFTGTLNKYQGGQCASCAYAGPPTLIGNDGQITISFISEVAATVTLPGGRTTSIQPFNFAFGAPPQGLLGEWIFVYDIIPGGTTSAQRFNLTTIGGATSTGTGVVVDPVRFAACEQQISGTFAGYVVCIDWTTSALTTVENQYKFRFGLDEGYGGEWISPTSSNSYSMKAFKVVSKSGVSRISRARREALSSRDEGASSKSAPERIQCGPTNEVPNIEMAQLIEEARQVMCALR